MREAISNLFNFGEDVGFPEQVILLLILELHFGAAEFRQENLISDFHAHRDVLTGLKLIQLNENTRGLLIRFYLISRSRSDRNDGSSQDLALRLLWDDNSTSSLGQCFGTLDQDAVKQWNQFLHEVCLKIEELN